MKYKKQIFVLAVVWSGFFKAEHVEAVNMLRHHLERVIVLSVGMGDSTVEQLSPQLLFLYKQILMQDLIDQVKEMQKVPHDEIVQKQRMEEFITTLEKAVDDCFKHQRITVVDWPEKNVQHQHANPLCHSLRSFYQFMLQQQGLTENK